MVQGLLNWFVKGGRVASVQTRQNKQGEPYTIVEMQYFGGSETIMVDPTNEGRFRPFVGKMVDAQGTLSIKENQFGTRVNFEVTNISEAK